MNKKKEKASRRKNATKKTSDTVQGREQQHQNKIYAEYTNLQSKMWVQDVQQKEYNKSIDNIDQLIYALGIHRDF